MLYGRIQRKKRFKKNVQDSQSVANGNTVNVQKLVSQNLEMSKIWVFGFGHFSLTWTFLIKKMYEMFKTGGFHVFENYRLQLFFTHQSNDKSPL